LEADLVPRAGLPFEAIPVRGLVGKSPVQLVRGMLVLAGGMYRAWTLVRKFRPDVVVGTGGYVSGPVLLVSTLLGTATLIQEQNVFPGVTNRVLSRWVDVVAVPHVEARKHFPREAKLFATGNPVRREVVQAQRRQGLERFSADGEKLQVLVVGGSRGAGRLNEALLEALPRILSGYQIEVTWVTGSRYHDQLKTELATRGITGFESGQLRLESYLYDLHLAYAIADLFVGRAGAMTLAEITARGIPAILVPSPNVTHDHQTHNARVLEKAGAAVLIPEAELTGRNLAAQIGYLVEGPRTLEKMREASLSEGKPAALDSIVDLIEGLAEGREMN